MVGGTAILFNIQLAYSHRLHNSLRLFLHRDLRKRCIEYTHEPRRACSDQLVSTRLERLVLQYMHQLGNTGRLLSILTCAVHG